MGLTSRSIATRLPALSSLQANSCRSAFFNNITYTRPKVPTLYTVLTAGELASNPAVYGEFTHSFVLERGQIVDLVV